MISRGDYIENMEFPGTYGEVMAAGFTTVTYHVKDNLHFNICRVEKARQLPEEEVALLIMKGVL